MSASTKVIQAAAGADVAPEGAWDLSFAYADEPSTWDISKASISVSRDVSAEETSPEGIFFKPDGTKMYIVGAGSDSVQEYDLSTAWDVFSESLSTSFNVGGAPRDLFFKPDGTQMYTVDNLTEEVNEYDLSTAWDVSSASFQQSFDISNEETNAGGLFFKTDGTKMYVTGFTSDEVHEYDLSTAWDISSASLLQSLSVSAKESAPQGLHFRSDGLKMYLIGQGADRIHEYDLSTAWDVSSASFLRSSSSLNASEGTPTGVFLSPDGDIAYFVGRNSASVYPMPLAFDVSAQDTNPRGVAFKTDGTKMYMVGDSGNDVNEYDLSSAWDLSTATYSQTLDTSSQEASPEGIFFKPDGTLMFIVGDSDDEVNEFSLSSAWDISSASHVRAFSVATEQTSPTGIFFKPDGTKMYISGNSGDEINEYDLSTAWNISTASHVQVITVSSQDSFPTDVFFKDDGTKMFVAGLVSGAVFEYDLSTSWDISSATFSQSFGVNSQPAGIFFKPDGTQLFVTTAYYDKVFTYSLGVQE